MKKALAALLLLLATALAACGGGALSAAGAWELETVTDTEGMPLPDLPSIACDLEPDGTLSLSGDWEETGTYTTQIADDQALRLEVELADGTCFTGTCGIRYYDSGESTPVLLLGNEDYILSFLPA